MQNFEDLGSALQLLGCNPIEVEPGWMRPTPKHRPCNAVRSESSPGEDQTTDATADPYQIMDSAPEYLATIPHSSPEREPGLSRSESSFEVVQTRTSFDADPAVVPGLSPHPEQNLAAPSVTSDQEGSAILPLFSSQSSCFLLPLGQKTIGRPVVAPAVPRLSDPARRPLSLRMPSAPVVRHSPRPRFSKRDIPFAPVQRPGASSCSRLSSTKASLADSTSSFNPGSSDTISTSSQCIRLRPRSQQIGWFPALIIITRASKGYVFSRMYTPKS